MMISKTMNSKLNEQIMAEFSASHQYLAMACSFEGMGFKFLSKRFMEQSEEEREHALKIQNYVVQVGGTVALTAIPKPENEYKNVEEIVRAALENEREVTRMINDLVALAESEDDYATRSFLNWFVDEQVEEVSNMTDLLQLVRLAGKNVLQVEMRVRHDMSSKV